MTTDTARFQAAIERLDAYNAADPHREIFEGREEPKELIYARRMSAWLTRLQPEAGEVLRLAARCQHIGRWEFPREQFPEGRAGYLAWRARLAHHHAEVAGKILAEAGYDAATIARVQSLVRKERLKADPEVQRLEDVICLVFLEFYFADFSRKHEEAKLLSIVRKTWRKMSEQAQRLALTLPLSAEARSLIGRALSEDESPAGEPGEES